MTKTTITTDLTPEEYQVIMRMRQAPKVKPQNDARETKAQVAIRQKPQLGPRCAHEMNMRRIAASRGEPPPEVWWQTRKENYE